MAKLEGDTQIEGYYRSKKGLYLPKDEAFYNDNPWALRIEGANRWYDEWSGRYKVKLMTDYFRGFQWKQRRDYPTTNYNPYTLNLISSTIKIKIAGMIFQKPQYLISPNPGNMQWEQDFAVQSAQLKEQVLNTIVTNPSVNFTRHVKRAARDSFFRFGVLEIGYAADWRNPQKDDPYLESWDDPDIAIDDDKVIEDTIVPENERFYVKRINPARFRVAVSDALDLNDVDWCGYYDFYYTSVLKHTKGIKWPDEYGDGDCLISAEYASGFVGRDRMDIYQQSYNMAALSKVWHIWDRIKHKRLLLLEGEGMYELWSRDFARLPFIDLRWIEEDSGFYPIPPVFDWLSPQDEINEAREQTRSYRRRFTRKFQTLKGQVDEEEKEKFSSGPDGILVEVKSLNAISP